MQNLNVKEDVLHQHHLNLKTHVTAKLLQYKNVEMEQQADLQDVETTKLLHVKEDAHQHLNHVTVKLLQYKNVEQEQQTSLQDVETTKLLIVTEDVILTDLHQTHVIVKLKL
jgi:hypothetical protein